MAKSLVLTVDEESTLEEIEKFVEAAKEYDLVTKKTPVSAFWREGKGMRLILHVPEPPKAKPKKPTKKQIAVQKQIAAHRAKKKNGEPVPGYVPPVGRKTAPKPKKVKCPVCGFKKAIVNVSGVSVIKPHVVQGEACAGSGQSSTTAKKAK